MFQTKQKPQDDYEKYIKLSLQENYYFVCLEKCVTDYSTPISGQEKVCLAKCLDRAYDSLRLIQKTINPFDQGNQKKYYYKLDGQNVLGLRKDQML